MQFYRELAAAVNERLRRRCEALEVATYAREPGGSIGAGRVASTPRSSRGIIAARRRASLIAPEAPRTSQVDCPVEFARGPLWEPDGLHMSALGYAAVGEGLAGAVRDVLS